MIKLIIYKNKYKLLIVLLLLLMGGQLYAIDPVVEVEEIVTRYEISNNGSSPIWADGVAIVARNADDVFVSVIETGKDVPPSCNNRWQLWHKKGNSSWNIVQQEQDYKQREPCPISIFDDGTLFLSVNPTTQPPGTRSALCHPLVLEFPAGDKSKFKTLEPAWAEGTFFTYHSYRGFASDSKNKDLLLMNMNSKTGVNFISYRDRAGKWHQKGTVEFPIRACYSQVALKEKAAYIFGVSDIVEPIDEWRNYKYEQTKRKWDYVFRRLFYVYTPNIEDTSFSKPLEVDSVEETAGYLTNLDLYVDGSGLVHILYLKKPYAQGVIRDKYFPHHPINTVTLEYMQIRDAKIVERRTLAKTTQGSEKGFSPSGKYRASGRFHADGSNNLWIIATGTKNAKYGNFLYKLSGRDEKKQFHRIPLEHPFRAFFTATTRAGSMNSNTIDLFGIANDNLNLINLRYAKIILK